MTYPTTWEIPSIAALADLLGVHAQWRERALCRSADPSLFDSAERRETTGRWRRYPQRVEHVVRTYCTPCPVRQECRTYAAEANTEGVWGGEWRWRKSGGSRLKVIPVALPETATDEDPTNEGHR